MYTYTYLAAIWYVIQHYRRGKLATLEIESDYFLRNQRISLPKLLNFISLGFGKDCWKLIFVFLRLVEKSMTFLKINVS